MDDHLNLQYDCSFLGSTKKTRKVPSKENWSFAERGVWCQFLRLFASYLQIHNFDKEQKKADETSRMSTEAADSPVRKLQPYHVFDVTSLPAELRNALNGKRRNKGPEG